MTISIAVLALTIWFLPCTESAAVACPSVTATKGLFVDGYNVENVLYADTGDACAVKCGRGWLWLGKTWPDFMQFESVSYVGPDKTSGLVLFKGDDLTSSNITCTCPPPECATNCSVPSRFVSCTSPFLVCNDAQPISKDNGTCTLITCPEGTRPMSPNFEPWRLTEGGAVCGADGIFYGSTGWILKPTDYLVSCAVDGCSNQCSVPQPAANCPIGYKCDSSLLTSSTDANAFYTCFTAKCKSGFLYVMNDIRFPNITLEGSSSTLQCGLSSNWYRTGGIETHSNPQVTCVTGKAAACSDVSQLSTCPAGYTCNKDALKHQSGQTPTGATFSNYYCTSGFLIGTPELEKTPTKNISCGSDGGWTTGEGAQLATTPTSVACAVKASSDVAVVMKPSAPCTGQWSEWADTPGETCPDICGSCGRISQTRTCTPAGCNCDGPSTQKVPCGRHVCLAPRRSCCIPYKKLSGTDGKFQCL